MRLTLLAIVALLAACGGSGEPESVDEPMDVEPRVRRRRSSTSWVR